MLPTIVDAVRDELEIFFDSGIRCGADIAKALALCAKCCLVRRLYVCGLVLGGEDGVSHVRKALFEDLDLTSHLSGIPSVLRDVLNRKLLLREDGLWV
jgi:lactate 2-monooxygenase